MPDSTPATSPDLDPGAEALDRLDKLVSLLLDDAIEADDLAEVQRLLVEDERARRRYLELTQLEGELSAFFRESRATDAKPSGVVAPALDLGSVADGAAVPSSDRAIG